MRKVIGGMVAIVAVSALVVPLTPTHLPSAHALAEARPLSIAESSVLSTSATLPPGGSFIDDDGNTHEGNIEAIRAAGITFGCNPPTQDRYCPGTEVTREQMAAFLRRSLGLPDASRSYFTDVSSSTFQRDINALRAAGVTFGCNPPKNDKFCPKDSVTREQMAAFLVRAFGYPATSVDYFTDDSNSTLQSSINALAQAGVTFGCNPPSNTKFCPRDPVKRDQMASFFARALGLPKVPVEPRPIAPSPVVSDPVTPGAFCRMEYAGWYGYSATGVLMRCTVSATDDRLRWRAA